MAERARNFRLVPGPGEDPGEAAGALEALLACQGYACEPEPFHPLARRLTAEPAALGSSLAARFGRIYIQDRSSMLPPVLLSPHAGASVLDMCASPGSKTGFLSQLTGPDGFVLGVEPSKDRLATLRANLRRMGAVNAATAGADSSRLPFGPASWPFIQLDPPCSGWGTAEKNPQVLKLWTGDKTRTLIRLQRDLLAQAARMLAPGGRMLYSTCTTNVEENEDQTLFALGDLGLELLPLQPPPGFVFDPPARPGLDGVLRVSEQSEGQGFFLAAFGAPVRDAQPWEHEPADPPGRRLDPASLRCDAVLAWQRLPRGEVRDFGGRAFFLPRAALGAMPEGLPWQGHLLGKVSGRDFRPEPLARILMPPRAKAPDSQAFDAESPEVMERLLAGQAVAGPKGKGPVGLYWRGLGLCWLGRKGERLFWSG